MIVRIRTADGWQDIGIQGPKGPTGVPGPTGVGGGIQAYLQPSQPASVIDGVIWIDTDDAPPTFAKVNVQDEGVALPQRTALNFVGSPTAADDIVNDCSNLTIGGSLARTFTYVSDGDT